MKQNINISLFAIIVTAILSYYFYNNKQNIISKSNEKIELQKCLENNYSCKILCEDKQHNKYIYYDSNKSFISCNSIAHYGCLDEKHRKILFCKKLN